MLVSLMELTQEWEVENTASLESAHEDAKGLTWKVTLLEGELVQARQAQEVAEEKFRSLSDASADGAWRLVFSKMESESSSRSFPFCRLGAPSCVLTLLAHHRRGIYCQRGYGPLPSAILRWPKSLLQFGRQ
jgi:hypothetical protein